MPFCVPEARTATCVALTPPVCWICGTRRADSGEHRFKASDVRAVAPRVSQSTPSYLQLNSKATNTQIGSARADKLKFARSICTECNSTLTQPYDLAWESLSSYLRSNWPTIARRGQFDLSKPFPGSTRTAALHVHLYFVKLFGCKLHADLVPVDLAPFSRALLTGTAHPEISLTVAEHPVGDRILAYDSEVHTMRDRGGDLHGALWAYVVREAAIKIGYIRAGAALHVVGHPWHPSRPGKIVKLSAYRGATEPDAGTGGLRP